MRKKKVLFILPWLPYPLVSGGCQAVFNGILAVKDEIDPLITFSSFKSKKISDSILRFNQLIPNAKVIPFYKTNHNWLGRITKRIRMMISKKSQISWEYDNIVSSFS